MLKLYHRMCLVCKDQPFKKRKAGENTNIQSVSTQFDPFPSAVDFVENESDIPLLIPDSKTSFRTGRIDHFNRFRLQGPLKRGPDFKQVHICYCFFLGNLGIIICPLKLFSHQFGNDLAVAVFNSLFEIPIKKIEPMRIRNPSGKNRATG